MGGTMGPFVAIAGAIFTFLAFYMQKLANDEIKNQFESQKFESQFYEMLKLHKENVNEIEYIDKIENNFKTFTGRKAFEKLYLELKDIYTCIEKSSRDNLDNNSILKKSYLIFFFGIRSKQNQLKCQYKSGLDIKGARNADDNIYLYLTQSKSMEGFSYGFGHSNYLAHIYRHLYLTVKFVVGEDEKVINYKEKRKYLRILRAQLSNYEQALLYYNWKSGFGKKWEEKDEKGILKNHFFTDYRMIHNLNNEMLFDNSSLESIKEFKEKFQNEEGRLHDPLFEFQD
ncbi:putative phage abortive infection protein [Chryseobacterium soli]|uniref:putative phage abortive infection protein n=1 Tax=Chryseobacterium soli TaxID=445961 RepID=UPI00295389A9|nr:putative phage abortive infection protein [Chryseobacterium soli]MDV7698814.1 putative phage abortive infection protein [Chryseobacterium soli]